MPDQENTIKISDLAEKSFEVPYYQRGYKWRARDVEYLIDDLCELPFEGTQPYYLQPLVVVKKDGSYIVVDGQQRLTTIFLIIKYLNANGENLPSFEIAYQTRQKSTEFLKNIDSSVPLEREESDSTDIRHFKQAYQAIKKRHDKVLSQNFKTSFKEKMSFLWYELSDIEKGPATFERLNGKRIRVSDAELCKAYLLSNAPKLRRSERAFSWEQMEYRLHDEDFFSFVSDDEQLYSEPTRMSLLLRMVVGKDLDQYSETPIYDKLVKMRGDPFDELTTAFHTLEQWYCSPVLYNFIGFLICSGQANLIDLYGKSEKALLGKLKAFVGSIDDLDSLGYKDGRTYNVLLLYNVLCTMQVVNNDSDSIEERFYFQHKFPFRYFSKGSSSKLDFDKEHVHATRSQSINDAILWRQYIVDVHDYVQFTDQRVKDEVEDVYNSIKDLSAPDKDALREKIRKVLSQEKFEELFDEVAKMLGEQSEEDTQNSIGNMALLSKDINRCQAYAAAPFAVKRAIIKDRVKNGSYVPEGTLRMFDKSFETLPGEMYHWRNDEYSDKTPSDREQFIEELKKTFGKI